MSKSIPINKLADTIADGLKEYANLATEDLKSAVKKTGNNVKKQIQSTAPKYTGAYAKSWSVK